MGLKLLPDQLARLDAWRDDNGQPTRSEAIRRLMDVALAAEPQPGAEVNETDFTIGDRVRSDVYGLGKVVSLDAPRPRSGMTGPSVAVAWDRAEWGIISMSPEGLKRAGGA